LIDSCFAQMQLIAVKFRNPSPAGCFADSRAETQKPYKARPKILNSRATDRRRRTIMAEDRDAAKNEFGTPDANSLKRPLRQRARQQPSACQLRPRPPFDAKPPIEIGG